jgi:SAM-dependent methyltransferase
MFAVADIGRMNFGERSFGFVLASNSLEHLDSPADYLGRLKCILASGGRAVIAVPPIYTAHDVKVHADIHYHRSNLTVVEWADLIASAGFRASGILHHARGNLSPNFRSHRKSKLSADDFVFTHTSVEALWQQPSITAIFLLEREVG